MLSLVLTNLYRSIAADITVAMKLLLLLLFVVTRNAKVGESERRCRVRVLMNSSIVDTSIEQ